jgi:hypothetical protein
LELDRPRVDRPGPDRPRGPLGPVGGSPERSLQALFGWFDADGDNLLSRREFAELSQFVERRRLGPPGGPRVELRLGRRGPVGPPSGDRDDVDRRDRGRRPDDSPRGEGLGRRERNERRSDGESSPRPPRPDNPPGPPEPDRGRAEAI